MLLPFSWSVSVCFLVPQKKLMILLTEVESLVNARFRGANAEIRSGQRDLNGKNSSHFGEKEIICLVWG